MGWQVEIWHNGLGERRIVKAPTEYELNLKVHQQQMRWEGKWQKILSRQTGEEAAESQTREAQARLENLQTLLAKHAHQPAKREWDVIAEVKPLDRPKPEVLSKPSLPRPPERDHFQPKVGAFMRRRKRQQAIIDAAAAYEKAAEAHQREVHRIKAAHQQALDSFAAESRNWEEARRAYQEALQRRKQKVAEFEEALARHDPKAMALAGRSTMQKLPSDPCIPTASEVRVLPDGRTIGVRLPLPTPEEIPTLESVSYLVTKDEFREKHLSKSVQKQLYDSLVYQLVLRAASAIIETLQLPDDYAVVINGMVQRVDPATGKASEFCIASIQVSPQDLRDVDLSRVDPKHCFRALKGVGSSSMHSLAAVAPVQVLDREDSRFVEAMDAPDIDESTNLASMDWQDFEHLVRTVFEQEFVSNGGEVKVTQASRDGGIDAVAFDPDPIRGGKIVIQAKRYVNVVGVSAVRDLYGAVQHEGAMKGILVTTSTFGPDAYKWAAGKPLQLLDGSNLLHLLERHGHKARIDRQEARRQLGLQGTRPTNSY